MRSTPSCRGAWLFSLPEEAPRQHVLPGHSGLSPLPSMRFPKVVYWSWLPEGHFLSRTRRQQGDAYVEVFFHAQALEGMEIPSE